VKEYRRYLYTIRQKTSKQTHLAYQRRKIGPWLQQIIDRCNDDILSPYLVHKRPINQTIKQRNQLPHWTYVTPSYLTRKFTKLRDEVGVSKDLDKEQRPTYHEIRGLSIDQHKLQNLDAKLAAGHTTEHMTENYRKNRNEIIWTDVVDELDYEISSKTT